MYGFDAGFEDVLSKIINISARKDLLETEFNGEDEVWVGSIYLDDHQESLDYNFSWKIGKKLYEQSEETQQTLRLLFL